MPASWPFVTGGAVTAGGSSNGNTLAAGRQPFVQWGFSLPDTFAGQALSVYGIVAPVSPAGALAAAVAFSGALTLPGVPGGGQSTVWGIQVNLTTGVLAIKSNTGATGAVAVPTPDAGNLLIMSHTITNGDTIPWMRAPVMTDLN